MPESDIDYKFVTTDPLNNTIYLAEEQWYHITGNHPEMHGEEKEIKVTIEKPDSIYKDKDFDGTFCYYRQHNLGHMRTYGTKFIVIVNRKNQGLVKTAYVVDKIIEKVREYPKPPKTK